MSRMDPDERIERLRTAESKILEAADIIEECIRMKGLDNRFGNLPDELRSMASSNDGDSVANLIRELEYEGEEQPGWTRPLASVKNVSRKDI